MSHCPAYTASHGHPINRNPPMANELQALTEYAPLVIAFALWALSFT